MSRGANLENTSLAWVDQITKTANGTVARNNRVLASSAERLVGELSGVYGKIQSKDRGQYEAQQLYSRLQNMNPLLDAATQKKLGDMMAQDLQKAEGLGKNSARDLSAILAGASDTLKNTAKPNVPAMEAAGQRLNDFWAKENTLFKDRVTAMTQAAAAEGKSWRQLAQNVRELLLLEKQAGTESARSRSVNARLGVAARAELIARTEMQTAYVRGQIDQFREQGYDWVRWTAAAERSCQFCLSRDGLVYMLEDVESSIPAHPRCRCSLIPVDAPAGGGRRGRRGSDDAEGGGKGGDDFIDGVDAAEGMDDAYWSKSRNEKLQQYLKDHPRTTPEDLIRYAQTPTNTQAYLNPGQPAPEPVWAPSGSLYPNLSEAVLNANKAAQRVADRDAAAQLKAEAEAMAVKERPDAEFSYLRHSDATGGEPDGTTQWTAERQQLHNEIIEHFLRNGVAQENPTFYMSGGGPASGKGFMLAAEGFTVKRGKETTPRDGLVLIDADEIKMMIPEYREMQAQGGKAGEKAASYVHEESSYLTKRIMEEAAARRYDTVLDGTGDNGIKSLTKKVQKMKDQGYRVEAKYVSADTATAVDRNWERYLKTGRLPPEGMLRAVHADISDTLPKAIEDGLFDKVELFDTNKSGELRKVLHTDDGRLVIDDQELYDNFLRKARPDEQADAKQSYQRYSNADGAEPGRDTTWTAEREKLHLKIIDEFLKDGIPSETPTFYMTGGGPASGKGYMLKEIDLPDGTIKIDADEIKKLLPDYVEMQKKGGKEAEAAAGYVHEESSYLSKRIMDEAAKRSFNTMLDGTGDNGIKSLAKKVQKMRDQGYRVEAKYVTVDTAEAVNRNWERFLKTGRLPPEGMLRSVHADISKTLPDAIDQKLFDSVELYDTNQTGTLRKVAHTDKNGGLVVDNDQLWDNFLNKAYPDERPDAEFSYLRHSNTDGSEPGRNTTWTAEREKLHMKIIEDFLKEGVPRENPTFYMTGGGPASGKGYMLDSLNLPDGVVKIDADEIKKLLPEYVEMQKKGGDQAEKAAGYVHEESSYLTKRIMEEAAKRRFDTVLDGTGDNGIASLTKKVQKMKDLGYRVEAKYVTVDTETAATRNWERYLKTGRLPPEQMLRNVHRDISTTLPQSIDQKLFDSVELYDTNNPGELRRVLHTDKDGKLVVDNDDLYRRFLSKADAPVATEQSVEAGLAQRRLTEAEDRARLTGKPAPEATPRDQLEADFTRQLTENSWAMPERSFGGADVARMVIDAANLGDNNYRRLQQFVVASDQSLFVAEAQTSVYKRATGKSKWGPELTAKDVPWASSDDYRALIEKSINYDDLTPLSVTEAKKRKQLDEWVAFEKRAKEKQAEYKAQGIDASDWRVKQQNDMLKEVRRNIRETKDWLDSLPRRYASYVLGEGDGFTNSGFRRVVLIDDAVQNLHTPFDPAIPNRPERLVKNVEDVLLKRSGDEPLTDMQKLDTHSFNDMGSREAGPANRNENILYTFTHETGHQVYYRADSPPPPRHKRAPTDYATTNYDELFAESWSAYVLNPRKLKEFDPNLYKWVDDAYVAAMRKAGGDDVAIEPAAALNADRPVAEAAPKAAFRDAYPEIEASKLSKDQAIEILKANGRSIYFKKGARDGLGYIVDGQPNTLGGMRQKVRDLRTENAGQPAEPAPVKAKPPALPDGEAMRDQVGRLTTDDIYADPERFQYKLNANKTTGEVGSLRGVEAWNEDLAGVLSVWKDPADGRFYVINGHNRLALAKRLGAAELPVLFINAQTAGEARAIGAKQNMANGDGTAVDAAKFMRDTGRNAKAIRDEGLNLKGSIARDGSGLAELPDFMFQAVVEGRLSVEHGSAIGRSGLSQGQMGDAYRVLQERPNMSVSTLDEVLLAARASKSRVREEQTLFGTDTVETSTMIERAELAAKLRADQNREVRVLERAAGQADVLATRGNVIDVQQAQVRSAEARSRADVFDLLKNRPDSKVAKALNDAAAAIQDAPNRSLKAKATKDGTEAVNRAIDTEIERMGRSSKGTLRSIADLQAKRDGALNNPPELELAVQPPDMTLDRVPTRMLDPKTAKVGQYGSLRPDQLLVDAERFQYKATRDAKTGEVGSLEGVSKWDPNLGGVLAVWRDPSNGQTYVINGHNRLALAKRLGADAVSVKFIDAPDAKAARAMGALANIAEGQGTAIDAAKFMRDMGLNDRDLKNMGVPLKKSVAKDGAALSNLPDDLWGLVVQERLSVDKAAVIGSSGLDAEAMAKIADVLSKRPNASLGTVKELVASEQAAMESGTTLSLFGDTTSARFQLDRAQLTRSVRDDLLGDKRLFGTLATSRAATTLESAGSTVNVAGNKQASADADRILAIFDQLKNVSGPVSEALNRGAGQLERTKNASERQKIKRQVRLDVVEAVAQELRGIPTDAPPPPPEAPGQESLFGF